MKNDTQPMTPDTKLSELVSALEHSVQQEHNAFMLSVDLSGENDADMLSIHREIVAQKDSEIERLQKLTLAFHGQPFRGQDEIVEDAYGIYFVRDIAKKLRIVTGPDYFLDII